MTGRGVDQILPRPSDPVLYERSVESASTYVELAERVHGPSDRPVDLAYIWGDALAEIEARSPDVRMPAAADWRAVFGDENEEGLVIETHLAGRALIEDPDGSQAVVGFDAVGEVENCEALENFLGYAAPGESASRWHREAVRHFQEHSQSATRRTTPPERGSGRLEPFAE